MNDSLAPLGLVASRTARRLDHCLTELPGPASLTSNAHNGTTSRCYSLDFTASKWPAADANFAGPRFDSSRESEYVISVLNQFAFPLHPSQRRRLTDRRCQRRIPDSPPQNLLLLFIRVYDLDGVRPKGAHPEDGNRSNSLIKSICDRSRLYAIAARIRGGPRTFYERPDNRDVTGHAPLG